MRRPYLTVAWYTWALFVLHETAAILLVDEYVLSPLTMQRAWRRLVDLGFPLLKVPTGTIADKLAFFIGAHPHSDFDLNDTDLTRVEAVNRSVNADKPQ